MQPNFDNPKVFCERCDKKHKIEVMCDVYKKWLEKFSISEVMLALTCNYPPETAIGSTVLIQGGKIYGDKASLNKFYI